MEITALTHLRESESQIAALSRRHLEAVVAIDSQSDERSESIPSTPGQTIMAEWLVSFFRGLEAQVVRDELANVIVTIPGRGVGSSHPPLALMAHYDTSRGTRAIPRLAQLDRWDGQRIPYSANDRLQVNVENYPAAREFLGHDLVFGPGDAPFGLDDKLGLTHLMTLVVLLQTNPEISHPPLVIIARPDEEIGRMAAVEGVAHALQQRGVSYGYTIDGILPFEINVENFHASAASVVFASGPLPPEQAAMPFGAKLFLGGVNTHGCTAKAEGFRAATRFGAELMARLTASARVNSRVVPLSFRSMPLRDCDAELEFALGGTTPEQALESWQQLQQAVAQVVDPHLPRGASWQLEPPHRGPISWEHGHATQAMLRFVARFLASRPGFVIPAEESEGRDGYSNPYRALPLEQGRVQLDIRLRDFDRAILTAREQHVAQLVREAGVELTIKQQYVNMGPRLAAHPQLADWARQAATTLGIVPRLEPIRGGTGVDPFLDRGIPIANLGTGYFAPESEKEFTSLQLMAVHVRWLAGLVEVVARDGSGQR
jgi:tripeptide aminopeptidase